MYAWWLCSGLRDCLKTLTGIVKDFLDIAVSRLNNASCFCESFCVRMCTESVLGATGALASVSHVFELACVHSLRGYGAREDNVQDIWINVVSNVDPVYYFEQSRCLGSCLQVSQNSTIEWNCRSFHEDRSYNISDYCAGNHDTRRYSSWSTSCSVSTSSPILFLPLFTTASRARYSNLRKIWILVLEFVNYDMFLLLLLQLANLMVEAESARQEVLSAAFDLLDEQVQ